MMYWGDGARWGGLFFYLHFFVASIKSREWRESYVRNCPSPWPSPHGYMGRGERGCRFYCVGVVARVVAFRAFSCAIVSLYCLARSLYLLTASLRSEVRLAIAALAVFRASSR